MRIWASSTCRCSASTMYATRSSRSPLPSIWGSTWSVCEAGGITIYDDFAHHPTAVDETLKAVRRSSPGKRIWAIFEPRSASSCRRIFQDDFARAFAGADEVVIASVFRSSLQPGERLSEEQLVGDLTSKGVHARHLPDVDTIVTMVRGEARDGDLIVVMSNGGFGQ